MTVTKEQVHLMANFVDIELCNRAKLTPTEGMILAQAQMVLAELHHPISNEMGDTCIQCGPAITFSDLQRELRTWQEHNFEGRTSNDPTMGVAEEIGELARELEPDDPHVRELAIALGRLHHHSLKRGQKIRGSNREHEDRIRDALGDITIFIMDIHNAFGWNFGATVLKVWGEVKQRNWRPEKGPLPWTR